MSAENLTFHGSYDPLQMNLLNLETFEKFGLVQVRTEFSVYHLMLIDTCFDGAGVVICGGNEEWLRHPQVAWYVGALTEDGLKLKVIESGTRLQFECIGVGCVRNLVTSLVVNEGIALVPEGNKTPFKAALNLHSERLIATDRRDFSTTIWEVLEGNEDPIPESLMQFLRSFPGRTQEMLRRALEEAKSRGVLKKVFRILELERTLWWNTGLTLLSPARNQGARLVKAIQGLTAHD